MEPLSHSLAMGITSKTVQRHMEILKAAFIIREMAPYAANVEKRLRKAPRYYFRDSGLLHALLGLKGYDDVSSHPALGTSWEGFGIEQIILHFKFPVTAGSSNPPCPVYRLLAQPPERFRALRPCWSRMRVAK